MVFSHDTQVSAAIEAGSWFALYAIGTPESFRCDLELLVEPRMTAILDRAGFTRLGPSGTNVRRQSNGDWLFRLSPSLYLTVSPAQAEQFFASHERIKHKFGI